MSEPQACPECLRRARLLAHLAPYIERISTGEPGCRAPDLLRLDSDQLAVAAAPKVADHVLGQVNAVPWERLRGEVEESGCWCCCKHDPQYPVGLRDLADAPGALFGRGDPTLLARLRPKGAVTIVGARRASAYGREVARQLGRDLADAGLLVISGLAFGIDSCAHRGALDAGATVGVLGCGADVAYPAAHRSLWRRIGETGLVLSELPPGCSPWRWTFPARGRIMAALAGITVVVEAAERSGSLVPAAVAADLGRDVGAVPGAINSRVSAGPNNLLADGARLVREAQDVLAVLSRGARRVQGVGPSLDSASREVLQALQDGARSDEEVAFDTDLTESQAAAALTVLEELGYAERSPIAAYIATDLQPPVDQTSE